MSERGVRQTTRWQRRMCSRKKLVFRTKHEAEQKAREIHNATRQPVMRAYGCMVCRLWHLTNAPERAFPSEWILGRLEAA